RYNAGCGHSVLRPAPGLATSLAPRPGLGWPATRITSAGPLNLLPYGRHPAQTARAIVPAYRGSASATGPAGAAEKPAAPHWSWTPAHPSAGEHPAHLPVARADPWAALREAGGSHWQLGSVFRETA